MQQQVSYHIALNRKICRGFKTSLNVKVVGKSVSLCKTTKRMGQLYISYLFVYGESSVKISTQTDSY